MDIAIEYVFYNLIMRPGLLLLFGMGFWLWLLRTK